MTVLAPPRGFVPANHCRTADEESLLKREMENAQIKAVPSDIQGITGRYQQLTQSGQESGQFSRAVDKWLRERKPAWFDFAEPKSLSDPRLADLDTVLKNPERSFSEPEIVKLDLLHVATACSARSRTKLGARRSWMP